MAHVAEAHAHDAHGHDDHHDPGFWRKWVFTTDHKMIGIQYAVTGLAFLFFLTHTRFMERFKLIQLNLLFKLSLFKGQFALAKLKLTFLIPKFQHTFAMPVRLFLRF